MEVPPPEQSSPEVPSLGQPSSEELRRRLYEPGATRDDVERFRAARAPDAEVVAAPRRPRPRGRVVVGAVAGLVVVVVVVVALAASVLGGARPATTATATTQRPVAAAPDEPVLASQSTRAGFVRALSASSPAGILPYLQAHPEARPAELRTVRRADSTEFSGEGATVVPLAPSALAERGGRVTVIVVTAVASAFRWRATAPGGAGRPSAVATHAGTASAGLPLSRTFAYARSAPTALTVTVPGRVRWGLVVVFTD